MNPVMYRQSTYFTWFRLCHQSKSKKFFYSTVAVPAVSVSTQTTSNQKANGQTTPLQYCVDLVKTRDYEGYLCSLLLPKHVRDVAFAVRAFNVELASIGEQVQRYSGTANLYRLQFWKDTIEILYGEKNGVLPKQPVAEILKRIVVPPHGKISKRWLMDMIKAREQTLTSSSFDTTETFEKFAVKTQCSPLFAILEAMDIVRSPDLSLERQKQVEAAYSSAESLGKALAYMGLIRATGPLSSQEIVLIPKDIMDVYKITEEDVIRQKSGVMMKEMGYAISDKCHSHSKNVKELFYTVPKESRVAFLGIVIVEKFLLQFVRCSANLHDGELQERSPLLAWNLWWSKFLGTY